MRRFILNNISTALVARFVRDIVRKAAAAPANQLGPQSLQPRPLRAALASGHIWPLAQHMAAHVLCGGSLCGCGRMAVSDLPCTHPRPSADGPCSRTRQGFKGCGALHPTEGPMAVQHDRKSIGPPIVLQYQYWYQYQRCKVLGRSTKISKSPKSTIRLANPNGSISHTWDCPPFPPRTARSTRFSTRFLEKETFLFICYAPMEP